MTLLEKLNEIKARLDDALERLRVATEAKGVLVPKDTSVSDMAPYIERIYQSNFEFVFNFLDIDQFGNPHMPNTGQETGGITGITPEMFDVAILEFLFKQLKTEASTTLRNGAFGLNIGSNVVFDFETNIPKVETLEMFNELTVPEKLNYDPSLETA